MMLGFRSSILVTVAALLIGGCARSQNDSRSAGGNSTKDSSSSPAASVGPGNTPKVSTGAAATDIKKFWFDSPYDPKGKREWTKVGPDKWDEKASDGTVNHYVGSDRYDMGGYHGIVVRGGPDDLNILIPDGGKGAFVRFREAAGGRNWSLLAPIDGVE